MKIHLNYDLMNKLATAKRGYDLKQNIKFQVCLQTVLFCLDAALDIGLTEDHKVAWMTNLFYCIFFGVLNTHMNNFIDKKFEIYKERVEYKIRKLASDLKILQVNTNVEMLKEAELVQTNYKFKLNNKKIPVLKQDKYIKIPVVNGMGERFEETLYQEHIVGTKDYDLSVKEPDKKVQVKRKLAVQM